MKKLIISLYFLVTIFPLIGQMQNGLSFLDGLHQGSMINPAYNASHDIVIGLPSAYMGAHQNGLRIEDVLNGELGETIQKRKNQFLFDAELSVLKVSIRRGNFRYSIDHNYRMFSDLHLSNPFLHLIFNGNARFIGGSVEASPHLNFSAFSETGIGIAYVSSLSLGVKLKFLNGIQNLWSEESDFSLAVNDDIYQLNLQSSFLLNSSFPIDFESIGSDSTFNFSLFPANYGFATDIGFHYEHEKFSVAGSLLDIGSLRWKDQVHNYSAQGEFVFEGISYEDVREGNFEIVDTIGSLFSFETSENSYNKHIPFRFYLNSTYKIVPDWSMGMVLYGNSSLQGSNLALAFNTLKTFRDKHAIGLNYTAIGSNPLNLGLSAYTSLGPVQLYAVADNIFGFVNPLGTRSINARIGINLVFNKRSKVKDSFALY